MTLSELATLGSIVSSLAVAASLIYLGVQTHQAAKHTRALISQGRSARLSEFIAAFSETDRMAAILEVTSGTPPTPELIKRTQAWLYFQGCVRGSSATALEATFLSRRNWLALSAPYRAEMAQQTLLLQRLFQTRSHLEKFRNFAEWRIG